MLHISSVPNDGIKNNEPGRNSSVLFQSRSKKLTQSIAVYQKFVPKIKELKALECRMEKLPRRVKMK
jgi:hypothetical protein